MVYNLYNQLLIVFLCMGMTLAIFRTEENCPVEKDILKISLNCWEMSFFSSFEMFTGMLFGPHNLCESREDIIKDISFFSIGVKKKVFEFV